MITLHNQPTQTHNPVQSNPIVQPILLIGTSDNEPLIDLAHRVCACNPQQVEIIGQWIWVTFNRVPEVEHRAWMKDHKFRYNPNRQVWQYAGCPSRKTNAGSDYIKTKYGVKSIDIEDKGGY